LPTDDEYLSRDKKSVRCRSSRTGHGRLFILFKSQSKQVAPGRSLPRYNCHSMQLDMTQTGDCERNFNCNAIPQLTRATGRAAPPLRSIFSTLRRFFHHPGGKEGAHLIINYLPALPRKAIPITCRSRGQRGRHGLSPFVPFSLSLSLSFSPSHSEIYFVRASG